MRIKGLLLLMPLFCLFFPGYSQAITLDEAIDMALKNNPQILLAREEAGEAEQKNRR